MYNNFYLIVFLGFAVCYFGKALEIFGSSRNAVVNELFTITCSGNSNNLLIVLNFGVENISIVNFRGAHPNNTCDISGKPDSNYTYRCVNNSSTVTYSTTIPGNFINEELHLSKWTCRNPFTKTTTSMILHVDVPVTSVTITPVTVEIPVTSTKTIKCESNAGRPTAIIQWFLSDGKNLTASATQQPDCKLVRDNKQTCSSELTYKGSLVDHGKSIFCEASNVDGKIKRSQNVSIYIEYGPNSVVLSPSNLSYTVPETTGIVGPIACAADCRPNCTMLWTGPNVPDGTASVLNLQNISRSQAGGYQCTASNGIDTNISRTVDVIVNYGPNFVELSPSNKSYTVTEGTGSVGPINCTADCRPNCIMTWSGPNLPDGITTVLNLQNINRNQTGNYQCTANNSFGTDKSRAVEVIVNYGPYSVVLSPSTPSYTVTETTGIVSPITCTADCRPNCTMIWSGPNLPEGITTVLNLQNISRNQTGNFKCTATNSIGTNKSRAVEVIVNYGPNFVELSPLNKSYTVTEGTGRVGPVTCRADCRPNCTMTWSGPNLPGDTASILNLQNIIRNQTGNYSCTAKNDIKMQLSENVAVVVNYGPSFVRISPTAPSYIVTESTGSIGPITCTADCRPNCTMTWSGPNLPGGTTSVLDLKNLNRNQAGDYWCTASNTVNSSNSTTSTVTVHYLPEVKIKGNVSYSENDTAKFQCITDSIPPAKIKWHFIDLQNRQNTQKLTKLTLDETHIEISKMSCLSTGKYICEAKNSVGTGEDYMNVTVTCAPRLNTIENNISHVIGLHDNEPLNVTVPILSFPTPWIYWQLIRNNTFTNITNGITNTNIVNRHTSNLFIENMTEGIFGNYAIHAGNTINTGDYIIAIYNVQSSRRPNPPSNVTCLVGSSFIIINWQPEFDGGNSQSFRVFYRSAEESLFIPHNENISEINYHPARIKNLIPSTSYWLQVHASNIHNFTASKVINCNTSSGVEHESSSLIAVGVGAGIGSAVLVLGVVFVVFFVLRRLKPTASGNDKEPIRRANDDDGNDDLKDNPLYVSCGSDVVYSQTTRDNNTEIDKKRQKLNKMKGKGSKEIEMGCVYENSDDFMKKNGEQIYANEKTMNRNLEPIELIKKNKDGLIYADLELAPVSNERRFIIRGLENKSNYAIIDLSKKADPLPSDDEDETNKQKSQ